MTRTSGHFLGLSGQLKVEGYKLLDTQPIHQLGIFALVLTT